MSLILHDPVLTFLAMVFACIFLASLVAGALLVRDSWRDRWAARDAEARAAIRAAREALGVARAWRGTP